MTRLHLRAAVAALTLALAAVSTSSAGATSGDLIEASPDFVAVDVPAPGHSNQWTMSATNVSDSAIRVSLEVIGESDLLFSGSSPLTVAVMDSSGSALIEASTVAELMDQAHTVGSLQVGESLSVTGAVTLPRSAGNEYLGADGVLTLRFLATPDDDAPAPTPVTPSAPGPADPSTTEPTGTTGTTGHATGAPGGTTASGSLASTGTTIVGALMIVGVLIIVGSGLRRFRSRKEES